MRTVFVDANVLIAASASRRGASHAIIVLAEIGMVRLVLSRQVLDEAERNIRQKLPAAMPRWIELLMILALKIVDDPVQEQFWRWAPLIELKDAPILEAAVQAQVDFFITLNTKDFTAEVAAASGLTILTPAAFVRRIRATLEAYL